MKKHAMLNASRAVLRFGAMKAGALALFCTAHGAGAQVAIDAQARSPATHSTSRLPQQVTPLSAPAKVEAARVQREISRSPALRVEAASVSAAPGVAAPTLSEPVEPAVTKKLPPNAVLYRPLTVTQERDVRALLSEQLKWPSAEAEKGRVAVFQGAVETAATQGGPPLTLKAIAAVDAPMSFDPVRRVFEGRVQVGFVEIEAAGAARPLAGKFAFQVQGPVSAAPVVADVHTTAPPFEVIRVASADPGTEVEIMVRSSVNPDGARLTLPVVRPALEIVVTPARIQGFGLEAADILLRSGAPQITRGARVQLASDSGRIEPLVVELDEHGTGSARLRSASIGAAIITASGAPFAGRAERRVEFVAPWSFVISAALGGLAGGIVRKGTRWRASVGRTALELLVAVLTGAIVFGLFALGVNLTGFELPRNGGEILVFVVAALGAFVGAGLFAAGARAAQPGGGT